MTEPYNELDWLIGEPDDESVNQMLDFLAHNVIYPPQWHQPTRLS